MPVPKVHVASRPVQMTMDEVFTIDILARNVTLILHALADAQSYREDLEDEAAAEAYAQLTAELEEFTDAA